MTRDWEGNDEATDSASSAEKAGFETGVGMSYCPRRGRDEVGMGMPSCTTGSSGCEGKEDQLDTSRQESPLCLCGVTTDAHRVQELDRLVLVDGQRSGLLFLQVSSRDGGLGSHEEEVVSAGGMSQKV